MSASLALSGQARAMEQVAVGERTEQSEPPPAKAEGIVPVAALSSVTTTAILSGTTGRTTWYVSAVTVTLSATAAGETVSTTRYQLDGDGWIPYTMPFVVGADGLHTLEYYSTGSNGTVEPTQTRPIAIDTMPPSSSIDLLDSYQASLPIHLQWNGNDDAGSGVVAFDIQYRDGYAGGWRDWLTRTAAISATFGLAERGHFYYFRSRAQDAAGNMEAYRAGSGDTFTFIDSVENGGFETGSFTGWTVSGVLSSSIVSAPELGAFGRWAALLGNPELGAAGFTDTVRLPSDSYAAVAQRVHVPSLADMPAPALSIWYHIVTFDVVLGCETAGVYDSFDIDVLDETGAPLSLLLRDGYYDCQSYNEYIDVHGVAPKTEIVAQKTLSLSPYAGGSVMLQLSNSNRIDGLNNTWTYVDSVHVVNQPLRYFYRTSLPVIVMHYPTGAPRAPADDAPRSAGNSRLHR